MTSRENPKATPDKIAPEPSAAPEAPSFGDGLRRLVETAIGPNLQGLPPQNIEWVIEEVTTMVSMSGPLPPPSIAREYEQICPGYVDRSLAMAEKEQDAAIEAQRDERNKNQFYRLFGMVCAAFVLASLVFGGIAIAVTTNVYVGSFLSLSTVVASAVTLFVHGRPLADGVGAQADDNSKPTPAAKTSADKTGLPTRRKNRR